MAKITTHPLARQALKVIQITDTHLFGNSDGCLLGLNTGQSLQSVIASIQGRSAPYDLVLATGDLVHDGTRDAYQRVFGHLKGLGVPVYCLPGNHDEADILQNTLEDDRIRYVGHACHGDWHFIFLNSAVPGQEGGHLVPETLRSLDAHLSSMPDKHSLVCLHHQPVMIGSRWLDSMAVDNSNEFFAIIDRHPQVRGILWGHVHQQFDRTYKNVRLMATPSTCIQFLPRSSAFAIDNATPGYRWLHLYADGSIETGVERLDEIPGAVDLASSGY